MTVDKLQEIFYDVTNHIELNDAYHVMNDIWDYDTPCVSFLVYVSETFNDRISCWGIDGDGKIYSGDDSWENMEDFKNYKLVL